MYRNINRDRNMPTINNETMKQKYYHLNDGRYCYIVRRYKDMCYIVYQDCTTELGDVNINELIKVS